MIQLNNYVSRTSFELSTLPSLALMVLCMLYISVQMEGRVCLFNEALGHYHSAAGHTDC